MCFIWTELCVLGGHTLVSLMRINIRETWFAKSNKPSRGNDLTWPHTWSDTIWSPGRKLVSLHSNYLFLLMERFFIFFKRHADAIITKPKTRLTVKCWFMNPKWGCANCVWVWDWEEWLKGHIRTNGSMCSCICESPEIHRTKCLWWGYVVSERVTFKLWIIMNTLFNRFEVRFDSILCLESQWQFTHINGLYGSIIFIMFYHSIETNFIW